MRKIMGHYFWKYWGVMREGLGNEVGRLGNEVGRLGNEVGRLGDEAEEGWVMMVVMMIRTRVGRRKATKNILKIRGKTREGQRRQH